VPRPHLCGHAFVITVEPPYLNVARLSSSCPPPLLPRSTAPAMGGRRWTSPPRFPQHVPTVLNPSLGPVEAYVVTRCPALPLPRRSRSPPRPPPRRPTPPIASRWAPRGARAACWARPASPRRQRAHPAAGGYGCEDWNLPEGLSAKEG
jgi:hypothetical protein